MGITRAFFHTINATHVSYMYHPFVALLAIAVQQFFMPQKIAGLKGK